MGFQPVQGSVETAHQNSAATPLLDFPRDRHPISLAAKAEERQYHNEFELAQVHTFGHLLNYGEYGEEIDVSQVPFG